MRIRTEVGVLILIVVSLIVGVFVVVTKNNLSRDLNVVSSSVNKNEEALVK